MLLSFRPSSLEAICLLLRVDFIRLRRWGGDLVANRNRRRSLYPPALRTTKNIRGRLMAVPAEELSHLCIGEAKKRFFGVRAVGGTSLAIPSGRNWSPGTIFPDSSRFSLYPDATLNRSVLVRGSTTSMATTRKWLSKSGQQPAITHDVLYYFYRREATTAAVPGQSKPDQIYQGNPRRTTLKWSPPFDCARHPQDHDRRPDIHRPAIAGESSFKIPIHAGTPKVFTTGRAGAGCRVLVPGRRPNLWTHRPAVGVEDLTCTGAAAPRQGICSL